MKILILGGTGMLGNAVGQYFLSTNHDIHLTYRTIDVIYGDKNKWVYFDAIDQNSDLVALVSGYDYVINCIGTIKPFMAENPLAARLINVILPWRLAQACEQAQVKLLHITTDCVYSGKKGEYTESDVHDALDDYGKSKSLGEPIDQCMVIRTSIIGEEIHKNASLIAWAKSQKGQTIKGFTNHLWNGITTNQYAVICNKIIAENLYEKGLFHVFAKDDVNKLQMMEYFNEKYQLDLTIEPFATENTVDRRLRSEQSLCEKLNVPTVKAMIDAL